MNLDEECRNACRMTNHEGMVGKCDCMCHKAAQLCTCGDFKAIWHSFDSRLASVTAEGITHRWLGKPCFHAGSVVTLPDPDSSKP